MALAYLLSLFFAVGYGYIAAYNQKLQPFMVAVLDILQSIPVLSFLPGVMLAMVSLFPAKQLGVELGSIILIFTGQVWNMAFSFYSSLRSIPRELTRSVRHLSASANGSVFFNWNFPYGAIGLIWNSIVSVAGGWFFLMACEMFVLGKRDFRLPGLGSWLQTAAEQRRYPSMLWGLAAMIGVILLIDQLVWRPAIAWSSKFKFEQVESARSPDFASAASSCGIRTRSTVFREKTIEPFSEKLSLHFARRTHKSPRPRNSTACLDYECSVPTASLGIAAVGYGVVRAFALLRGVDGAEFTGF